MAEEYVKGRLPQESNPTPGRYPGFVASHDTTGSEDYRPTSPDNPLPTSNYIQRESGVWVPISKDNPMPTQLTGSNVEDGISVSTVNNNDLIIESRGVEITAGSGYYLLRHGNVTNYTKLYAYVLSSGQHDFRLTFDFRDGQSSSGITPYVKNGENFVSEGNRTINVDIMDVTFPQVDIYIRNGSDEEYVYDGVVRGFKN